MRKFLIFWWVLVLTGCSTIQYVPLPNQEKEVDNPSKGRIYVIRPSWFGGAVPMSVRDDSTLIGKTYGKGYLCWEHDPGNVTVTSKSENTETLQVLVKEGRRVYLKQSPEMGILWARNSLSPLYEEKAKGYLKKLKPPKVESS